MRNVRNFLSSGTVRKILISAVVHMDESTPHLHLNLIPVIDGRLCGKRLFDRKALHNLQTELYEAVGKKWNLQRGKEGSQAKHLSTAEFKAKKIVEQAHGEADALKANAERKVKIAQIHAEGIIASAEQSAVEAKQPGTRVSRRRNQIGGRRKNQANTETKATSRGRAFCSPHGERRIAGSQRNQ